MVGKNGIKKAPDLGTFLGFITSLVYENYDLDMVALRTISGRVFSIRI